MNRICVFCGSKTGNSPLFLETAIQLGRVLAERGLELVYGGASIGLMGAVADSVMAGGGKVVGVIPEAMASKEVAHDGVTEMHVVSSMHERKSMMARLADAFVALPGGFGSFEELLEMITWAQLGIHRKPVGILNVNGYYDPLIQLFEGAIEAGFIKPRNRQLFVIEQEADRLLQTLLAHKPPEVKRWITERET